MWPSSSCWHYFIMEETLHWSHILPIFHDESLKHFAHKSIFASRTSMLDCKVNVLLIATVFLVLHSRDFYYSNEIFIVIIMNITALWILLLLWILLMPRNFGTTNRLMRTDITKSGLILNWRCCCGSLCYYYINKLIILILDAPLYCCLLLLNCYNTYFIVIVIQY